MNLSRLRLSRDTILFTSGLAGVFHQTLVEGADRPTLLVLYAGMMGLPAFLRTDEKSQKGDEKKTESP